MRKPSGIDDRPAKGAAVALTTVAAALIACAVHAGVGGAPTSLQGSPAVVDPCIAADEDLRHPGWARPEQARAGQPLLDDPRTTRWFVSPAAVRVVR